MSKIIAKAQAAGSTATTNAGARRYLLAHLPPPVQGLKKLEALANLASRIGLPLLAPRHPGNRNSWYAARQESRMNIRADRYAHSLGVISLSAATAWAETEDRAVVDRIGLTYADCYAVPSGSWAGGNVGVSITLGDRPAAHAETVRVWSDNGKWSGNDLSARVTVTRRAVLEMGAEGLVVAGLLTLDAEKVGPREFRATWAAQKGALGLKTVSGWIIRGYHSIRKTLAAARKEAAAARSEQAQAALKARARKHLAATGYRGVWVTLEDSLAAGNCRPVSESVKARVCAAVGGPVAAVRGDVLLSIVSAEQYQRAVRACEVARHHG